MNIKPYLVLDKGEKQYDNDKEAMSDYAIAFVISNKEWNDLQGQIKDAIRMLKKYRNEYRQLIKHSRRTRALLDFPIDSRLNKKIWVQVEYFPVELLTLCSEINISIVITLFKQ